MNDSRDRFVAPSGDGWAREPETMPANLKKRINNLLWMTLPPDITLDEADAIAVDFYSRIGAAWERHRVKLAAPPEGPGKGGSP